MKFYKIIAAIVSMSSSLQRLRVDVVALPQLVLMQQPCVDVAITALSRVNVVVVAATTAASCRCRRRRHHSPMSMSSPVCPRLCRHSGVKMSSIIMARVIRD